MLRPSDLPAGWTLVGQDDWQASDLPTRFCLTDYPGYVAGSSDYFSYHLDPKTGYEQGHLQVDVKITDSDADTDKQLQRLQSADSQTETVNQCLLERYPLLMNGDVGSANVPPGAKTLSGTSPAVSPRWGTTTMIFRASVPYRFLNSDKVMYFDDIRIQKGRVVGELVFYTCCKAFDYGTNESAAVDAMASRMAAASGASA